LVRGQSRLFFRLVRRAYRVLFQENSAVHVDSSDDLLPLEWAALCSRDRRQGLLLVLLRRRDNALAVLTVTQLLSWVCLACGVRRLRDLLPSTY
jgi:hypothetical protein